MRDVAETLLEAFKHHRAGLLDLAEAGYCAVLADQPEQPNATALWGHLLAAKSDPRAVAVLSRAVSLRPGDPEIRLALGNVALRDADREAAEAWWRAALAIDPAHVGASVNLAGLLRDQSRISDAITVCRAALAACGDSPLLWQALAESSLAGSDFPAAVEAADQALARDSGLAEAWLVRGTALAATGALAQAAPALATAVRLRPGSARAQLNHGNLLCEFDQLDQARDHLCKAVAADPALPEAWTSLGALRARDGALEEAVALHDRALSLRPGFVEAHVNRAAALLLAGRYPEGFAEYEWRKRHPRFSCGYWRGDAPEWQGEDPAGRTLLIFCEQGLGDVLMCARYFAALGHAGARLVLVCAEPLFPLFRNLRGVISLIRRGPYPSPDLVALGESVPAHDAWVDSLSLPRLFGTRPDHMPGAAGYLAANPGRVAGWRERLPPGPKIGLVWAGNPAHSNDRRRSSGLAALAPILALPGARFLGLQPGLAPPAPIIDLGPALQDFGDTAAVLMQCDALVSVDSSVAHLAGALGVPCALLLPHAPDWRWLVGRDDTPWYASLTLFRQRQPGQWEDPVARVVAWVEARLAASSAGP